MSGQHTVMLVDPLNNHVLAEAPCSDLHHSRFLNDNGVLEGAISLSDPNVKKLNLMTSNYVEPGMVAVYCARDGILDWCGLMNGHSYSASDGVLHITAGEYGSFLATQYYDSGLVVTNMDSVAFELMVLQPAFNVVTAQLNTKPRMFFQTIGAGTPLSTVWYNYEQHNQLDQLKAAEAINVDDYGTGGFDWSFDPFYDSDGNPSVICRLMAPRRGQSWSSQVTAWDFPGNLADFGLTKSTANFATDVMVTGAGSGKTLLQSPHVYVPGTAAYLDSQLIVNNANLTTQVHVNAFATGTAQAYGSSPPFLFTATILSSIFYASGLDTGDEITINVDHDDYFPSGAQLAQRINAYDTTAATDSSPELTVLTLGPILAYV
jgi:hypothetical protein